MEEKIMRPEEGISRFLENISKFEFFSLLGY
jgi:hypothetical protein